MAAHAFYQSLRAQLSALVAFNTTTPHPNPVLLAPQFLAAVLPLAPSSALAQRTLATGTAAAYLDVGIVTPGIHAQQDAADAAASNEYPATAAMTTGYVFRTENQATVAFMQRVGVTGALVTCAVTAVPSAKASGRWSVEVSWAYAASLQLTAGAMLACGFWLEDGCALSTLLLLLAARTINVMVLRRRATPGWHGLREPGVVGDLLVLLSQDRWVRLRGLVDDLKAVTSGSWLKPMTRPEKLAVNVATVLVYAAGAAAMGASVLGAAVLVVLLLGSMLCLRLAEGNPDELTMHERRIKVVGAPRTYAQRAVLARELIKEHDRDDWAITLGMIVPDHDKLKKATM